MDCSKIRTEDGASLDALWPVMTDLLHGVTMSDDVIWLSSNANIDEVPKWIHIMNTTGLRELLSVARFPWKPLFWSEATFWKSVDNCALFFEELSRGQNMQGHAQYEAHHCSLTSGLAGPGVILERPAVYPLGWQCEAKVCKAPSRGDPSKACGLPSGLAVPG